MGCRWLGKRASQGETGETAGLEGKFTTARLPPALEVGAFYVLHFGGGMFLLAGEENSCKGSSLCAEGVDRPSHSLLPPFGFTSITGPNFGRTRIRSQTEISWVGTLGAVSDLLLIECIAFFAPDDDRIHRGVGHRTFSPSVCATPLWCLWRTLRAWVERWRERL